MSLVLIPVTTWTMRLRHLSQRHQLIENYSGGLRVGLTGNSLCDPPGNGLTVYDQAAIDHLSMRLGSAAAIAFSRCANDARRPPPE